ncbi:MAG TPA: hypothetical protein DCQ26_19490 [Marinilabiliales bacterium]|nr:MAG: hypothetical protein A2W95_07335 [Bacteroidetes bacterium GWA2_40_14]OFX59061.1 MAG: hypothetical protein A2W84_16685 [Bacteroidetes bacterium GWC2_40_13]OFX72226.1 MAG: hypothetical protein A2W96_17415 [Bacteroidetes bacterium GWD2_40_43]OFX90528.1 MAG: hypothetical protein A2W97_01985 [Bacteroidetes bacterium GWE2_40_63]OFY17228.1 MAG: hypothetical protein A2W88_14880 [Bacteroidetes bacterium GWF2_40_13]OFZ26511.1 MAG: hypothetical protein A2437_07425 [Bacteroidetes bacterium RIFOXYC
MDVPSDLDIKNYNKQMKHFFLTCFLVFAWVGWVSAQASFSYQGKLCAGNDIQFSDLSTGANNWQWDFGDGQTSLFQNPLYQFTDSGTFTVVLTINVGGTESSFTRQLKISKPPQVHFTADTAALFFSSYSRLFIDESEFFDASGTHYFWDFGDGNTASSDTLLYAYKYAQSGTYTVWHKVEDSHGCSDSTSRVVTVSDLFWVPNVFTPHEPDEINDQFIVISNGITLFSIDIYSRWGNRVFSRSGRQQIVWDGRMPGGELVKPGTYFYVITAQEGSATYEPQTGFVTVF